MIPIPSMGLTPKGQTPTIPFRLTQFKPSASTSSYRRVYTDFYILKDCFMIINYDLINIKMTDLNSN